MARRGFTRRDLLAASTGGACVLALSGCGGGGLVGGGSAPRYTVSGLLLETDPAGNLHALDAATRTVSRLAEDGSPVWTTPPDSLGMPSGIAFTADGHVLVADLGRHEVLVLDGAGGEVGRIGRFGPGAGEFRAPRDVVVDDLGQVFVADSHNHRIQVLDAQGRSAAALGEGALNAPCALALDSSGDLHVVDAGNERVVVFDRNGVLVRVYARAGTGDLARPRDLVIDASGTRFVVDGVGRCIQAFDPLLELPGACFCPVAADGGPVVPLRASVDPEGGLRITAQRI